MPTFSEETRIPIPSVSFETLGWRPRVPEMYSRAEVLRQPGRYEAAITPEIEGWLPQVSSADAADIEDATRALVEFDAYAQRELGIDNPALGPMSAILLRTESASSSQIEQLTTSAKQIALAEIGEGEKANALAVLGNVRAMEAALGLADDISESSILAMHGALMAHQPGFDADLAGRFREEQVWIGTGNAGPLTAKFVAPHHSRVRNAIEDLVRFMKREDLSVLVQVAVAHAQFETIHPFPDGNGRTGRALAQAILRNKGLVGTTTVPVSAGLLTRIEHYFEALESFRDGDAGPIVREFALASRIASATGRKLVTRLAEELEQSRKQLKGVRSNAAAWRVLPALVGQPVVNSKYLANVLGLGEMAALRALDTLAERGVVTETTSQRRGRVWQHRGMLSALDEYASEIRRLSR